MKRIFAMLFGVVGLAFVNAYLIWILNIVFIFNYCEVPQILENEQYEDIYSEIYMENIKPDLMTFSTKYIEEVVNKKDKSKSYTVTNLLMPVRLETDSLKKEKKDIDYGIKGFTIENILKYKYPKLHDISNKYVAITDELKYYPVAEFENDNVSTHYSNSWNGQRTYGGDRKHKGCDIMAGNNKPGYFPVVSATDGVITNIGWLELGGFRVGVESKNKIYYYYAHLDSYVDGLKQGDEVKAGQMLGFMGDTGYGEYDTRGKFDTHLHFGIYLLMDGGEYPINPYYFLENIKGRKLIYSK